MTRRLSFVIITVFIAVTFSTVPVLAAKTYAGSHHGGGGGSSTPLGNDISYPQCGGSYPSGQAFGIVGVNGGLANNFNSCFSSQLAWAQNSSGSINSQTKTQLYINTGNPGDVLKQYNVTDWPTSSVSGDPYGTCSGTYTDDKACSWQYGYDRAQADMNRVGLSNYVYWLDVETSNSWTSDSAKNQAALEGMAYYLESNGATVGIYSTAYQWGQIVGTNNPGGNLNGLASWLPGAKRLSSAQSNCNLAPLTSGGKVTVTQFTSSGFDYDYSCI